ncbi:MAG: NAD(+) kinase [Alectoria fallacina]|uniref:NAD(+) kinase n=1 Tax=Alectoria fallacina TaxID=1903189 RepID=A0A8H3FLZ5_9LECA|nr:MAG: NAD(+) kinase [Alectoria fallacina]
MQSPATPRAKANGTDMTQLPSKASDTSSDLPGEVTSKAKIRPPSTFVSTLLRDYQLHLDPLNTDDRRRTNEEDITEPLDTLPNASTQIADSPLDLGVPLATSPSHPTHSSWASMNQRKGALPSGSMPNQTMLKALASRTSKDSSAHNDKAVQQNLAASMSGLGSNPRASFATRFAQSPCFFHQRFDDAVNIERVLEEISAEDDGMSHSRLMQTATSVREISKQLQRRPIKRAVRTIMIITKARDNKLVYLTRELTEFLLKTPRYSSDLGVTVYVDAKLRTSTRFDAAGLLASNPRYSDMLRYWTPDVCWSSPGKFDLVLTLGGDGTVLFTSRLFQRIVPPILSFALGSLGFLTNFPFDTYKPTLDRIMEGSGMRVNMRMRFTCTVYRAANNKRRPSISNLPKTTSTSELIEDSQFEVLNELVIDRGPSPYVSNLELYGDTHLLTIIQADGCIISTPTGSTAYSLSAGGPLTHPSIPGILLTPICPHTLSFRPMVLSDTLCLRICVPKGSRSTAYASFDGKGRVELRRGDEVRVEAGRYPFPTVVGEGGTGGEWFESVRRALRWNTRGAVQRSFGAKEPNVTRRGGGRLADDIVDEEEGVEDGMDEEDEGEEEEEEEEEWDIDADPIESLSAVGTLDSGLGASEEGSSCASPLGPTARRMDSETVD